MPEDSLRMLGKAVRQRRLALGWSQERLAEQSELHWTYIGGIERGERNVGFKNLVRIARALKLTPSELVRGVH